MSTEVSEETMRGGASLNVSTQQELQEKKSASKAKGWLIVGASLAFLTGMIFLKATTDDEVYSEE